jgi:hypothetical protein
LIAKGCISEGCIAAPSACRTMIVHCTTSVWHSLHDFVARQGGACASRGCSGCRTPLTTSGRMMSGCSTRPG